MRILFLITVCLSLILSSCAQTPHPCKSPPLLEGKLTLLVPEQKLRVYEKFYYDAIGQNVRMVAAVKESNETIFVDRLLIYSEQTEYEIHYHNKSCVKKPLKTPFRHLEIPNDAHFLSQMVLGSSSEPLQGLLVNNWEGISPITKEKYYLTFTVFGCLPLYEVAYTETMEISIMASYFDLVEGIEDPEAFIPPSFC